MREVDGGTFSTVRSRLATLSGLSKHLARLIVIDNADDSPAVTTRTAYRGQLIRDQLLLLVSIQFAAFSDVGSTPAASTSFH